VGHDLRHGAHGSQQGKLIVGTPSGHKQADGVNGNDRDDVEESQVQCRRSQTRRPWHNGKPEEYGNKDNNGCHPEKKLVCGGRRDELFLDEFQDVCQGLQRAMLPGFHRSEAVLYESGNFTLAVNRKEGKSGYESEQRDTNTYICNVKGQFDYTIKYRANITIWLDNI